MTRTECLIFSFFCIVWPLLHGQSNGSASSPTASAKPVWAAIGVANLDVSRKWYQENLGFHQTRTIDSAQHKLRIAFLDLNGFTLELIEFKESVSIAAVKKRIPELTDRDHLQGFVKLGFRIANVDALAAALERSGIKLRMEPTDDREFNDRFLLVEDPDGNTLQFFQELR